MAGHRLALIKSLDYWPYSTTDIESWAIWTGQDRTGQDRRIVVRAVAIRCEGDFYIFSFCPVWSKSLFEVAISLGVSNFLIVVVSVSSSLLPSSSSSSLSPPEQQQRWPNCITQSVLIQFITVGSSGYPAHPPTQQQSPHFPFVLTSFVDPSPIPFCPLLLKLDCN